MGNRCYANTQWDKAIRHLCKQHGVVYQGFSLLTANPAALQSDAVKKIGSKYGKTPEQLIFRWAEDVGMMPLTGTNDLKHMLLDLGAADALWELTDEDRKAIENAGMQ